ncbi:DUF1131 family protein [Flammeovirga kamogawensis]|uniref:DUF1131 domain-containing protein n=1 Tax=Flammeovirga kamogawensis TaxID=373891 RepID=A0ABX8GY79_9BACT|nr:DUF1131 family protein [Flammeovirga kamogawensis]MBB6458991.1 hypothetical protein [Flammeovirga kamogawensis]QWG08566.1 DUF1131 domain-containing protein [Flammeovirga kamogawensis]TRX66857.1 DUF1131 family protein [Flammeovirga kamogawensis]
MKVYLYVLIVLSFLGCSSKNKKETVTKNNHDKEVITETNDIKRIDKLYEHSIYGLKTPFEHTEMLGQIRKAFPQYKTSKIIGRQDGPDFPLYVVKNREEEVLLFSMDWKDTLKLNSIYVRTSEIIDEYGLKVGDGYHEIKSKRNQLIKTTMDYHQHTYAYVDGSNIMYEITGDVSLPDTVNIEDVKFTEEQLKDWKIESIIWRE